MLLPARPKAQVFLGLRISDNPIISRMRLPIVVLLALGSLRASQASTGIVEGIVARADTIQTIAGARVTIWGDMGPEFETTTDAKGHYVLRDVPAGIYNIEVQADGYLSVPKDDRRDPPSGPRQTPSGVFEHHARGSISVY